MRNRKQLTTVLRQSKDVAYQEMGIAFAQNILTLSLDVHFQIKQKALYGGIPRVNKGTHGGKIQSKAPKS